MLAYERLQEIESAYGNDVERIVLVEHDEESIRLVFFLRDGSNLRVAEQWSGVRLIRYSYYWLTSDNRLIAGWDNPPITTICQPIPITNTSVSKPTFNHLLRQIWMQ